MRELLRRCLRIEAISAGSRDTLAELVQLVGRGALRPVIDRVFSFAEVPAALRHLRSGGHLGKVVVEVEAP